MHLPLSELITVNGLPAHPLIVHGAVVLTPLAVLAALGYLVPRWRDHLRWPLVAAALLAFVFVWAAYLTGENFKDSSSFFQDTSTTVGHQIHEHEELADVLRWVTTGFAIVAVAVAARWHARAGAVRTAMQGLLAVLAVATLVYVFLTGEAGAKAVYPPNDSSSAGPTGVVSTR